MCSCVDEWPPQASLFAVLANTIAQPGFDFLVGDLRDKAVYANVPANAFDLVVESWAWMYVTGFDLFLSHVLPAVYAALAVGGHFVHEGPIGVITDPAHSLSNPAPSAAHVDYCRLLAATGHFRLVEDVRYQSRWSMLRDLAEVNTHARFAATDAASRRRYTHSWSIPRAREGGWLHTVSSDCLVQKVTDVSTATFAADMRGVWRRAYGASDRASDRGSGGGSACPSAPTSPTKCRARPTYPFCHDAFGATPRYYDGPMPPPRGTPAFNHHDHCSEDHLATTRARMAAMYPPPPEAWSVTEEMLQGAPLRLEWEGSVTLLPHCPRRR